MASQKKLLEALAKKPALAERRKELLRAIREAQHELSKVEAVLALAAPIDKVLNGVPISIHNQGNSCDMETLASGANTPQRSVHLYQRVKTDYWAIRVNEHRNFNPRFYGGHVLGLDKAYNRKQAQAIAERWLTGDDTVLG